MEKEIILDSKSLLKLDKKVLQKSLEILAEKAREFLERNITEVYLINSKIRIKENYVPLDEMLSAIEINYDANNLSFSIGIDEDQIDWEDKFGEDIYEVESEAHDEEKVKSLTDHWKTPIGGIKEDEWFLEKTAEELSSFIKKDFVKII